MRGTASGNHLVNKRVPFIIAEDNEAVIKIISKGRCPTMRHINRTHRVAMDWLPETCCNEQIGIKYMNIRFFQTADILTKHYTRVDQWFSLCRLMNIKSKSQHQPRVSHSLLCIRAPSTEALPPSLSMATSKAPPPGFRAEGQQRRPLRGGAQPPLPPGPPPVALLQGPGGAEGANAGNRVQKIQKYCGNAVVLDLRAKHWGNPVRPAWETTPMYESFFTNLPCQPSTTIFDLTLLPSTCLREYGARKPRTVDVTGRYIFEGNRPTCGEFPRTNST